MKKLILVSLVLLAFATNSISQNVYDEKIDASKTIEEAITQAQKENKYIFAIAGGNWCKWCLMFDEYIMTNQAVNKTLTDNFILIHVNYSKQNPNLKAMEKLGYPQRFGFPVFIILNQKGERIHTQNSAHLEQGEGYSEKEVITFLNHWNKKAVETVPKK